MQDSPLGFFHFIAQADVLAHLLLIILLAMSLTTWYLIVTKAVANRKTQKRSDAFLEMFWESSDVSSLVNYMEQHGADDPYSHVAHRGLQAADQYRNRSQGRDISAHREEEFLTRAIRRAIEEETARLEYGHTLLASIASSAPFVGLFGTVWGIYHALIAIGATGQGTLDKVAGPVGEALIMTALGLAVAIPAVLAYNAFNRANRLTLTALDGFAHDLFAFMTTGVQGMKGRVTANASITMTPALRGS